MRFLLLLLIGLLMGWDRLHAQSFHYGSFTFRSLNLPLLLSDANPETIISSYFNPYPAIGYGFTKNKFKFGVNMWLEFPIYNTRGPLNFRKYEGAGKYEVRSGHKLFLEVEGAYVVPIKDWAFLNWGITGMFVKSTLSGIVYYAYNLIGQFPPWAVFRQRLLYLGLPLRTGITIFPIKKSALGFSVDLLWHLIYKLSYVQVVSTGYYVNSNPHLLKPYLPEIRLRLHVVLFRSSGSKTNSETRVK